MNNNDNSSFLRDANGTLMLTTDQIPIFLANSMGVPRDTFGAHVSLNAATGEENVHVVINVPGNLPEGTRLAVFESPRAEPARAPPSALALASARRMDRKLQKAARRRSARLAADAPAVKKEKE